MHIRKVTFQTSSPVPPESDNGRAVDLLVQSPSCRRTMAGSVTQTISNIILGKS